MQAAFRAAIDRFEYQGAYHGVFPVKANHDKALIQAIVDYGEGQGRWSRAALCLGRRLRPSCRGHTQV